MDFENLMRSGKIKRFFRATRKLNVPHLTHFCSKDIWVKYKLARVPPAADHTPVK
jgi:hypothetical protein